MRLAAFWLFVSGLRSLSLLRSPQSIVQTGPPIAPRRFSFVPNAVHRGHSWTKPKGRKRNVSLQPKRTRNKGSRKMRSRLQLLAVWSWSRQRKRSDLGSNPKRSFHLPVWVISLLSSTCCILSTCPVSTKKDEPAKSRRFLCTTDF